MPNLIEKRGTSFLKKKLESLGHPVTKSDNKTFDLIVDGKYAEVKTKNNPLSKMDFISLTDKQFEAIKNDYKIYLVCNVKDIKNAECYEINTKDLRAITPKIYTSYQYNKSEIDKINKLKL